MIEIRACATAFASEIEHLLATCKMGDPSPAMTKRHRLHNAFVDSQNNSSGRVACAFGSAAAARVAAMSVFMLLVTRITSASV
jgi:hypothetical protein